MVPRRRRRWVVRLQLVRHLVQLGFLLVIGYVAVGHELLADGETASGESYCPFGGLETLYRWFDSGGKLIEHSHTSNLRNPAKGSSSCEPLDWHSVRSLRSSSWR